MIMMDDKKDVNREKYPRKGDIKDSLYVCGNLEENFVKINIINIFNLMNKINIINVYKYMISFQQRIYAYSRKIL
tara:strand:+ start:534 stop:758 length:225 start_codon:yes stop_codon:yes gene_type:complete